MLKKIVVFSFFFSMFYSLSPAQNDNSLSTLHKSDTTYYVGENLTDKICSLFTTNQIFSPSDIENSIHRSLGDLLRPNRTIDITRYGPYGQPEYATIWGSTSRQLLIYQDETYFFQPSIYLPQTGDHDLFSIPLENIESIHIIDNPVANILGKGIGLGGVRLKPKKYKTDLPFSGINYERGPYGYKRTQIDFGRNLSPKIDFYFTGGWKRSEGYITNSDFKSLYLTGNILCKIREDWEIRLKAFHFENRAGNPLHYNPGIGLRTKEDSWIIDLYSRYRFKNNTLLGIEALLSSNSAENYKGGYFLDREKKEGELTLKVDYEFNWNRKNQARLEGLLSDHDFRIEDAEKSNWEGYLSYLHLLKLSDRLNGFAFLKLTENQEFDRSLSAMGGVSYWLSQELSSYVVFSKFFSNPTLHDLYLKRSSYSVQIDSTYFSYQEYYIPFLKAEAFTTANIGFSWLKQDFKLSCSFFSSLNQDNLEWVFSKTAEQVPPYTYIRHMYSPSNLERSSIGLSLNFNCRLSPDFYGGLFYTYKRARSENDFSIPYVPEHSFLSCFQYSKEQLKRVFGFKIRFEQEYISRRYLADHNREKVPFVLLFNSKITLRFLDFQFYYVIENITDEAYRTRGDFDMPGRTLWFGFSWDFYD